jgi:hypothetical protein
MMTPMGWLIFQQVHAPPNYWQEVRDCLDQHFPDRLICCAGTIHLASMVSTLDADGFLKNHVYQPPLPRNVDELKARINAAVTQVIPETLQKV